MLSRLVITFLPRKMHLREERWTETPSERILTADTQEKH